MVRVSAIGPRMNPEYLNASGMARIPVPKVHFMKLAKHSKFLGSKRSYLKIFFL